MSNVVLNILSEFKGKKAFKQADTAVDKLTKSATNLGKALGVSLGTYAVVAFGKSAVQAFVEAEKASTRLSNVVDNLGLSFATANIQKNLDEISAKAGIAGEVLVDAFQPLITTTGSVTKSQELLNLALDVSAGSGADLATVTQDLANAYVGNFKGLKKYNLGLTQTELKTTDFLKVQTALNEQFSGSQEQYLATYAGKLQVLGEAAGNASEIIGGSLIDAFFTVSNSGSADELAVKIGNIAEKISDVIDGSAKFVFSIKSLFNTKYWKTNGIDEMWADYDKMLFQRKLATAKAFDPANNSLTGYKGDAAAAAKAERDAKKRAADLLKSQRALLAEQKKQAALKKASTIFDLTQAGIIAALKGNISDEDRKRLELQLAIEQGNVKEAQKLTFELAQAQGLGVKIAQDLASLPAASNPFAAWKGYLDEVELQAKRIAEFTPMTVGAGIPATSGTDFGGNTIGSPVAGFTPPSAGTYGTQPTQVNFNLDGKTLISAIMDQSLSGNQAYVNRRTGGFD